MKCGIKLCESSHIVATKVSQSTVMPKGTSVPLRVLCIKFEVNLTTVSDIWPEKRRYVDGRTSRISGAIPCDLQNDLQSGYIICWRWKMLAYMPVYDMYTISTYLTIIDI